MTTSRLFTRPGRAYQVVMAAGVAVVALALTACSVGQPQATPSSVTPTGGATYTATTTPTPPRPNVVGSLTVTIVKTTSASVVPRPPISYEIGVRKSGSQIVTTYPLNTDGQFALTLDSGTYEVPFVQIEAEDLNPIPVRVPLTATEILVLHAPSSGCIYGGHVQVLYGRLVSGSEQRQAEIVQKLAAMNKKDYPYIYLPNGGLIITGAKIDIPALADRPPAARDCVVEEFTSVPAKQ